MAKRAKTAAKTVTEPAPIPVKPAAKKAAKNAAKKATKKAAPKARKTTKKSAAKKSAPTRVEVYKLAQDAPGDRFFILANGRPVKHVAELAEIMEDIEDHVFAHHVNAERNDFHNWVKDVFEDVELAKKILGVSHQKELQLVIYKHAAHKAFKR